MENVDEAYRAIKARDVRGKLVVDIGAADQEVWYRAWYLSGRDRRSKSREGSTATTSLLQPWIPAFTGMTKELRLL